MYSEIEHISKYIVLNESWVSDCWRGELQIRKEVGGPKIAEE